MCREDPLTYKRVGNVYLCDGGQFLLSFLLSQNTQWFIIWLNQSNYGCRWWKHGKGCGGGLGEKLPRWQVAVATCTKYKNSPSAANFFSPFAKQRQIVIKTVCYSLDPSICLPTSCLFSLIHTDIVLAQPADPIPHRHPRYLSSTQPSWLPFLMTKPSF